MATTISIRKNAVQKHAAWKKQTENPAPVWMVWVQDHTILGNHGALADISMGDWSTFQLPLYIHLGNMNRGRVQILTVHRSCTYTDLQPIQPIWHISWGIKEFWGQSAASTSRSSRKKVFYLGTEKTCILQGIPPASIEKCAMDITYALWSNHQLSRKRQRDHKGIWAD